MDEYESLSHTRWDCKYHVVFIPKCRRKALYGELRRHLGEVFKKLAADTDEAGHAFQSEAGHLYRSEAGHRSDLMSATGACFCGSGSMMFQVVDWSRARRLQSAERCFRRLSPVRSIL